MKAFALLLTIALTLFYINSSVAQPWLYKKAKEEAREEFSPAEKVQLFNEYYKNKKVEKGKGFMAFKRWEYFVMPRANKEGVLRSDILWEEYLKLKDTRSIEGNWTFQGPWDTPLNIGQSSRSGSGRVNAVAFHPTNPNIIFIGAPAGGFWKSTDGGLNWITTTDELPSIGISDIAVHPVNPDIIYIATGDADAQDTYSAGLLKSTDGGLTWNTTGYTPNIAYHQIISRVIIHPLNPETLYITSSVGLKRSVDGGATFTTIRPGSFRDMKLKPGNPSTFYISSTSSSGTARILKTVDGGATYSTITPPYTDTDVQRIALAVTASSPTTLYALCSRASDYGFHSVYRTDDEGITWDLTYSSEYSNLLAWESDGSDAGGQGWYDLALAVSPLTPDEVYVGGVNVWKSTDGGFSWEINGHWWGDNAPYVHADQHMFAFNPLNNALYSANDGGIYRTTNGGASWQDLSDGVQILQIYKMGNSTTDEVRVIAGTQDNGTMLKNPSNWDNILGGDGMDCMIDYTDSDIMYGEYYYGALFRSNDGGYSWDGIKPSAAQDGDWVTPIAIHPTNPAIIFAGYEDVYKSTNRGNSWTQISNGITSVNKLTILKVAPSNPSVIYAGTMSSLYRTTNGGSSWDEVTSSYFSIYLTDVTISDSDPMKIWASVSEYNLGEKVYYSEDGGLTWSNVSSGMPNVPVNCLVYESGSPDRIYAGTDLGVFVRDTLINTWIPFSGGLPNVVVRELEIHYPSGTIRAATYGRGLWKSDLYTGTGNQEELILTASIFPNPASDYLYVRTKGNSDKNISVTIWTTDGRLVLSTEDGINSQTAVSIQHLAEGTYVVKVTDGNSSTRKLINIIR